ncbi:MAG: LPS assembly protein LptD [Candidatus Omnitrophica bacterium]|nr:LPS assembly protein LptD [Candidatus Omnitrophota bacterium]
MRKTVFTKISRSIFTVSLVLLFGFSICAQEAFAGMSQEEEAAFKSLQARTIKVSTIMNKAREERWVKNFKKARDCGKKALRLDPDNREAQAFLKQLDIEEKRYIAQKSVQIERRKTKKAAEREAHLKVKAERRAAKLAGKEARRREKLKIHQDKISEKEAQRRARLRAKGIITEPEEEEKAPEEEGLIGEEFPEPREPGEFPEEGDYEPRPAFDRGVSPAAGQSIVVDGDKVEFFEREGRIVAEGNVSITHGSTTLTCDKIEVDTRTRQAFCEGNVRVEQPAGVLTGERIRYDFDRERGEVIGAKVEAFPWFGEADETSKIGENEYFLKKGFITTCDLDAPHYRVKAHEIRVFPNDKVIAKNVTFYIGKVPVLWLPYYYHPYIQSRAKVQFMPGRSSDWGYFLLSAWRFYLRGDSKADIFLDYRSSKGFAEGANIYYNMADFGLPGLGSGIFRMYFVHQNGPGTYDKSAFSDNGVERSNGTDAVFRQRLQWKHRVDFQPGTVGMFEFNKVTDENFLKDYFYNEYEEANRVPLNYGSIVSSNNNYSASILGNVRVNDFYTVVERLPEAKLDVYSQQLWNTPLYYEANYTASVFKKAYRKQDKRAAEKVNRLDVFQKISMIASLGPLKITPYGTFRGTFYSAKGGENKAVGRSILGTGVDLYMRFFKTYDVATNFLKLDINELRHIITPSAGFSYEGMPTVDPNDLYQMDSIDALDHSTKVSFSLENKLQTRRQRGDSLVVDDLARFIMSADCFYVMEKSWDGLKGHTQLRNFTFDLELRPYSWFWVDGDMEIDAKDESLKSSSVELSIRPWDFLRFDLGYRYEKMLPDNRNQLIMDLNYMINPKWKVGIYERFDVETRKVEEQQYSITRDLHCWEVEVVYDIDGSNFLKDEYTFWVVFKIKAFPDLPIGLDRSYERRPPGVSASGY